MRREKYIAVFDSGVGGVSVLRELMRLMPNEDYYYYGDSANAPYGLRETEDVRRLFFLFMAKGDSPVSFLPVGLFSQIITEFDGFFHPHHA